MRNADSSPCVGSPFFHIPHSALEIDSAFPIFHSALRNMTSRPSLIAGLVAIVLLFGTALGAQQLRERWYGPLPPGGTVLYVASGETARRLALSFDALLADVYWIRAVQYFGGQRLFEERKTYELLYPLLDVTTTLDPYFTVAYRFGAHFLAEPPPGGPGRVDQAQALLEKGLQAEPQKWEYMLDLGFLHYWWRRDFQTAAAWFQRGSALPGAPEWMVPLAAAVLTHGGDRADARVLWQAILTDAAHPWLQRSAVRALAQLDALDVIDRLESIVAAFTAETGRRPAGWHELVEAGYLADIPVDPGGSVYGLDAETGQVTVVRTSALYPLPEALVAPVSPTRR